VNASPANRQRRRAVVRVEVFMMRAMCTSGDPGGLMDGRDDED
jgi:hypothetical protein